MSEANAVTEQLGVQRLVLRYDAEVACWIDKRGNAWKIAALARVVDATRKTTGQTRCAFCGRDQKADARRRLHMLNECRKRHSQNGGASRPDSASPRSQPEIH